MLVVLRSPPGRIAARKTIAIAAALSLTLSVVGCETHRGTGALGGAAAGAAIGAAADKGGLAGILIGAAIGAFIGAAIGNKLDEAEQRKAADAARQAAESESASRVFWSSDKRPNVHGYAEVLEKPAPTPKADPDRPVTSTSPERCKLIRQVHYIEGKEAAEEETYCLRSGQWEKV
jgi:surface antigen